MSVIAGSELAAMAAANFVLIEPGLVQVEGGTFIMGEEIKNDCVRGCRTYAEFEALRNSQNEYPPHEVTLDTFRMGRRDVTNEQYARHLASLGERRVALIGAHLATGIEQVVALGSSVEELSAAIGVSYVPQLFPGFGDVTLFSGMSVWAVKIPVHNPPRFGRSHQPVVNVTWLEALVYAGLHGCKLPTEAQFEFAAGKRKLCQNEGVMGVFERWIQDWYGRYPDGPVTNPTGPVTGNFKVKRDMSWNTRTWSSTYKSSLRSTSRNKDFPGNRSETVGFLVAAPMAPIPEP